MKTENTSLQEWFTAAEALQGKAPRTEEREYIKARAEFSSEAIFKTLMIIMGIIGLLLYYAPGLFF